DVVQSHHHLHILPPSSSCRKSFQDIVDTTKHNPKPRKNINPKPKPKPNPKTHVSRKPENHASYVIRRPSDSYIPALTDLPEGHPSRNVVEIIFHTSWSSPKVFSGRIEMVFKVQNLPRTVTRFEEYREMVKSGSNGEDDGSREDHARSGGACDGAWSFQFGKEAAQCVFDYLRRRVLPY
nr:hypothetical protein [Tanacetum cinerariifolium]